MSKNIISIILVCVFSSVFAQAQMGQEIKGHIEQVVNDDFSGNHSTISTFVRDLNTQRLIELKSKDPKLRGLKTGTLIRAQGNQNSSGQFEASNLIVEAEVTDSGGVTAAAMSSRDILMVKINFADAANTCSDSYFTSQVTGDSSSISGLWAETNKGLWDLVGPAPAEVTIQGTSTEENCPYGTWASQARAEMDSAGISYSGYNHIAYVFPKNSSCSPWAGRASLGGSSIWIYGSCRADVLAHEMGHNLGFHHAGRNNEYGDYSDIMGAGGPGLRQVNAPRMIRAGWIDNSQYAEGGIGNYDLAPLELTTSEANGQLQVLTYQDAIESNKTWYLSYRQRIGYDGSLRSEYVNGLSVHSSTSGGYKTNLEASLIDGGSFSDPNGTFTVTQSSHDANGIQISVSANCVHQQPSLNFSPSTQSGRVGEQKSFNMTITNNDRAICGSSPFNVSVSSQSGLTLSSSFPSQINIGPGATETIAVDVTIDGGISDGSYNVNGQAELATETGYSAQGSAQVIVDSTSPTVPANLTASSGRNGVSLNWQASQDSSSVSYRIYRNGNLLTQTSSTSYTDSSVQNDVSYTYHVNAVDNAGNAPSANSNSVTITPTGGKGGAKGGGKKGGGDSGDGGSGGKPVKGPDHPSKK